MRISNEKQVGAVVKRNRLSLGLTQVELSERAGVSRRLLNDVENGFAPNIGLARLIAILDVLEVPLFIGGAPKEEPVPDYLHDLEARMVDAGEAAWALYKGGSQAHAE